MKRAFVQILHSKFFNLFLLFIQPDKTKTPWAKPVVTIVTRVCTKMKRPKHFVCHACPEKNKAQQGKHPATVVKQIRSVKAHPRPNAMIVHQEEQAKQKPPRVVIAVLELC